MQLLFLGVNKSAPRNRGFLDQQTKTNEKRKDLNIKITKQQLSLLTHLQFKIAIISYLKNQPYFL
jgi:hypothetical protein